ncbi:superoxide dismutase [Sporolactobacillus terrae]|uniref:Superoxide dismutase n=1 Tax=Sporolactobacillus terrae TaxID=269673 RepID=A0A410DBZ3_9BACL|nr:superoxide dismutase [Sporolactobacillus terrae]QAA23616.1 superoxide dismutase [Sporolactobacillus terrae]QAA26586.1 superoxide dismutase [Sporolactobacillus terrae]UAK15657.1 superoxide dismutase [Sporolactobacillus terrae]BBO00124.1 superoxide dismutase [Fe] [Sporolactobacillus terrae]
MSQFELPALEFAPDALEPYIDKETMRIHHDKHHQTYVSNLNAALEKHPEFKDHSLTDLIAHLEKVPEDIRTAVRNNGGGHYNHCFFWKVLIPGGSKQPTGALAEAIEQQLGGYEAFKEAFTAAATGQFGSGWAWLTVTKQNVLKVTNTPNQDSPFMDGHTPLVGLDVWEHAYYLKYQNRRPEYVKNFFNVINWDFAADVYEKTLHTK